MSKLLIAALLLSFAQIAVARADCDNAATDQERAECIGQELRAADKTINDLYQALRASRDDAGKAALRTQQIQWLKLRDQTCQSASKETDREKWFANLLTDFGKTVCVVRFTNQRVAELTAEQAGAASAPAAAPAPATAAASASAASEADVYDLIANHKPSNGKWYFEATIDVGALAKISESTIFIGVQGDGAGNTGSLQAIRKRNAGDATRNIGIAVDLDVGKLYLRTNGAWQSQPGSANAPDLKLGRPYVAKLSSSVSLTGLPDGVIDLNFGAKPFAYALPDGYVPLDKAAPIRVAQPM
ncbi:lysozyme inhibitor LprI family protein [Aliidongia dinghuensis]|nr:lysozyme inhibitor LprI family protein [Aliidongia dinghuensis]